VRRLEVGRVDRGRVTLVVLVPLAQVGQGGLDQQLSVRIEVPDLPDFDLLHRTIFHDCPHLPINSPRGDDG
jgi:hypothetical protein